MNKKAFTLIEIFIVVGIVLILAAAAINGYRGIVKTMRFNNTFNKIVAMVQQARNMASNGKNTDIKTYKIEFAAQEETTHIITLNSYGATDADKKEIEKLTLNEEIILYPKKDNSTCASASVSFKNVTAETSMMCDALTADSLKIKLSDADSNYSKEFSIYRSSGIPQIQ